MPTRAASQALVDDTHVREAGMFSSTADLSPHLHTIADRNAYDVLAAALAPRKQPPDCTASLEVRAPSVPLVFLTPDATSNPIPFSSHSCPVLVVSFTVAARLLHAARCCPQLSRDTAFLYLSSHPERPQPPCRSCPKRLRSCSPGPCHAKPELHRPSRLSAASARALPVVPANCPLLPRCTRHFYHHHRLLTHAARSRTPYYCLDVGCYYHRCRSYRLYPSAEQAYLLRHSTSRPL